MVRPIETSAELLDAYLAYDTSTQFTCTMSVLRGDAMHNYDKRYLVYVASVTYVQVSVESYWDSTERQTQMHARTHARRMAHYAIQHRDSIYERLTPYGLFSVAHCQFRRCVNNTNGSLFSFYWKIVISFYLFVQFYCYLITCGALGLHGTVDGIGKMVK